MGLIDMIRAEIRPAPGGGVTATIEAAGELAELALKAAQKDAERLSGRHGGRALEIRWTATAPGWAMVGIADNAVGIEGFRSDMIQLLKKERPPSGAVVSARLADGELALTIFHPDDEVVGEIEQYVEAHEVVS